MGKCKDINRATCGRDVRKYAVRKGCEIKRGKGSHFTIEHPDVDGKMTCYDGILSKGVKRVVVRWFTAAGLAVLAFMIMVGAI